METMNNTHDKYIDLLFEEYKKCSKEKAVNGFLSSFGAENKGLRSGLPVFAIMQTFPKHKFQLREKQNLKEISPCNICSSFYTNEINDWEFVNECFCTGGLVGHTIETLYAYLKLFNEIEEIPFPKEKSVQIFSEILDIILTAQPDENLKTRIVKQIKKDYKTEFQSVENVQVFLETLGYCGILETENYKGCLTKYTNLAVAPKKTHSSDWNYPVDFWLGKDGINKKVLQFWFGNFNELAKY
jgi:hypothetical protein